MLTSINPPLQLAYAMRYPLFHGSVGVGLCNLMSMLLFDVKQTHPPPLGSKKNPPYCKLPTFDLREQSLKF
jgi:hypothetical protein